MVVAAVSAIARVKREEGRMHARGKGSLTGVDIREQNLALSRGRGVVWASAVAAFRPRV